MNIPGNRTNTARQAARLGATAAEWQKVLDRNLSQTLYNTVAFVEAALADRYGMETPERFEEAAQDGGEGAAYEMLRRKLRQVHGCEVELVQEEEAPVYVAEW